MSIKNIRSIVKSIKNRGLLTPETNIIKYVNCTLVNKKIIF